MGYYRIPEEILEETLRYFHEPNEAVRGRSLLMYLRKKGIGKVRTGRTASRWIVAMINEGLLDVDELFPDLWVCLSKYGAEIRTNAYGIDHWDV